MVYKKNILRIGLLIILAATVLLTIYTVRNYRYSNPVQSSPGIQNHFTGERGRISGAPNRAPGGHPGESGPDRPTGTPGGGNWGKIADTGNEYAPQLTVYAILFLVLSVLAYYLLKHKKMIIHPGNERVLILSLLLIGLLLRISCATLIDGHSFDINTFKNWANTAANNLLGVYSNGKCDYPPLYMYILFLIGKAASLPAISPYYTLLLKLPSIAADIATALIIYRLARKHLSPEASILAPTFYIFNPAIFINSTLWGQVDSFFTLIVVGSLYLLSEKKIIFSCMLFMAALLMKPQGIIFLPVLFFELVRQGNYRQFLKVAAFSLITATVITLPFLLDKGLLWIFNLFSGTVAEYPYASVNAFNLWSLLGKNYADDSAAFFALSYHSWGILFIVMITAFAWFIYAKGKSPVFSAAAALLQIAGVFTLSTRMHERYLFPAVALALLAYIYLKDKRLLLLAAGFSSTVYINTYYVLFETGGGIRHATLNPTLAIVSVVNMLLLAYLAKVLFDIVVKKRILQRDLLQVTPIE